ncbi:hypothetical protein CK489_16630 [Bradyrhizobium sp. UFLA03-84]|uniref:hypothetical protein n=1 Tax=Bradyrhizobium sp. UFLA03-84 TaxID=418599 RepID=UPI000BADD9B3|nr:hypothetical protein [Bradyrhizobium sp. UFLA03-84]PAY07388.1 hypothetical protein CK489_16630 [Bradyrhizobium sp. UFLA03-84]
MADEPRRKSLAILNFEDDLKAASEARGAERWKFDRRGDLELWVTVAPAGNEADLYIARLFWLDYPGEKPPSVKFVDPSTGRLDIAKAWPMANGFRPGSFDICANWTAEGFVTHPEWATTDNRWNRSGNIVLRVMRLLQQELD